MQPETALSKSKKNCYWLAGVCVDGAQFSHQSYSQSKELTSSIKLSLDQCLSDMNSDLKQVACVYGVHFYFTNLKGEVQLREKLVDTIPFIVYTAGHRLGLALSQLSKLADSATYKSVAKTRCEEFSFNDDVLKRCYQGMDAFEKIAK